MLSEKGKLKSIEAILLNLKILISEVNKSTTVIANEFNEVDISIAIIPKNKLDAEKERLRSLLISESNKVQVKNTKSNSDPPKSKKKRKESEVDSDIIPIVSCINELIGKRVEHLTVDYDGKDKWFSGVVICQKPDTQTN